MSKSQLVEDLSLIGSFLSSHPAVGLTEDEKGQLSPADLEKWLRMSCFGDIVNVTDDLISELLESAPLCLAVLRSFYGLSMLQCLRDHSTSLHPEIDGLQKAVWSILYQTSSDAYAHLERMNCLGAAVQARCAEAARSTAKLSADLRKVAESMGADAMEVLDAAK